MKMKIPTNPTLRDSSEENIRDYAYHLYVQSGCIPGRDSDNWFEAEACIRANIPKAESHTRLRRHTHRRSEQGFTIPSPEAKNLAA